MPEPQSFLVAENQLETRRYGSRVIDLQAERQRISEISCATCVKEKAHIVRRRKSPHGLSSRTLDVTWPRNIGACAASSSAAPPLLLLHPCRCYRRPRRPSSCRRQKRFGVAACQPCNRGSHKIGMTVEQCSRLATWRRRFSRAFARGVPIQRAHLCASIKQHHAECLPLSGPPMKCVDGCRQWGR